MKETRIATRYAKALFELAKEQERLEQVKKDIEMVNRVCTENRELRLMLSSPVIRYDKKFAVIKEIFKDRINDLSLSFFEILIKKRREMYIFLISDQFLVHYNEFLGIKKAHLKTAVPFSPDAKQKLIKQLEQQLECKITLEETVDEALIGGFYLTIDDKKFDVSIKHKIEKLSKTFEENIYIKGF